MIDNEILEQIIYYIEDKKQTTHQTHYNYNDEIENNYKITDFLNKISNFSETKELKNIYIQIKEPLLKKNFCGYSSSLNKTLCLFSIKWNSLLKETNKYCDSPFDDWKQILWFHIIGCPSHIKTKNEFIDSVQEIIFSLGEKTVQNALNALQNVGYSNILSNEITDRLYNNLMVYTFEESLLQIAEPI